MIKYFCKSLTGYMRNYISKLYSGKYIQCAKCTKLIKPTNNRQKYCKECARQVKLDQTRDIAREGMRKLRQQRSVKKIENR